MIKQKNLFDMDWLNKKNKMKKLFLILFGAITFSCGDTGNQSSEERVDENNTGENVEEFSGENITPQVDLDSGSNERLEVDTISSAGEAQAEE